MGSLYAKLYSFTTAEVQDAAKSIEDQRWAPNLKAQMQYIYKRLQEVFKDADTFANIMRNRAIPRWEEFVNPRHPKANKALAKMRAKLPSAYDTWKSGIDAAFGQNGYFDDRVNAAAAKDKYAVNVIPVLIAVGAPEVGPSVAPKLTWLLQGYNISEFLRTNVGEQFSDTLQNKPIVNPVLPPYTVATINAMLVDAIRWHFAFRQTGDDRAASNYLSTYENAIRDFISAVLNPNLQLNGFVLVYETNTARYRVEISIVDKTQG